MENSKPSPDEILEYCDAVHLDDGVSPHELARQLRKEQRQQKSNRSRYRLRQLCMQVLHGIDDALWCDCCDPLLSDLRTIDVKPVAGSSVLVATLITPEKDPETISLIHERLHLARGMIRSSVAGVIRRKKVPQLQFRVIPELRD
ncbi:MAG: hypothetical protein P1V20_16850 [Verrucomicrobiales bacterium]|nr:hypothetical protein [Verrucomicrobiales bacterium]